MGKIATIWWQYCGEKRQNSSLFLRRCTIYVPRIDLRIDSDRKQYEVAAYLHLNREVYRRYEKGEREIPVWAVIQLARLYGTSTDYILGLSDRR